MPRRKNQLPEAPPRRDITCEQCDKRGVVGGDIFPYLVSIDPPVHRWMHQRCAEQFHTQRGEPGLPAEVADYR